MIYHDYLVVGAGPAGLQMGYLLKMAGRDYAILEGSDTVGKFFTKFPRHRRLNSFNKRFNWFDEADFNMRFDWHSLLTHDFSCRFQGYSKELFPPADTLVQYLNDFREHFDIDVTFNTKVTYVDRDPETAHFIVTTADGTEYRCRNLLMATGPVMPTIPDIPGIEHAVGYEDHETDLEVYENKRVLIIGAGNSAFETANHLTNAAAVITMALGNNFIKHAWQTNYVGDVRSTPNALLDMSQLKMMHGAFGIVPTRITKQEDGVLRVYYREEMPHWTTPGIAEGWIPVDFVIRCTGWKYVREEMFAPSVRPQMLAPRNKYPVMSSAWESSTPGLFFLGAAMDGRNRRGPNTSIHGFRYAVRSVFNYLEQRNHGVPTPNQVFPLADAADLETLGRSIIKRISISSGLYEGHSLMSDCLVFDPEAKTARMFYEMPIDYFLENEFFRNKKIIIFTLEFGHHQFPGQDRNTFVRRNDPARPGCVAHLHPVFRFYENGSFVKGRNTRSSTTVRYDEESAPFEGEMSHMKPRNILLNFMNEIAGVTDTVYSEDHFLNTEEMGGFRPLEPGEQLRNPGLPECALVVGGEQVKDFDHLVMQVERAEDGTIPPWQHCR
ncbi:MAG: NAD(P)-binding domain-containing protein [Paracraurococcus sp.]